MLWTVALQLLIRSTLVLAAALLLRHIYRKRDPAFRYRLILFAFALLAILPVLLVILPAINLPVWPTEHLQAGVTVRQRSYLLTSRQQPARANWVLLIWLSGVALTISPMLRGALAARRLVRRARPMHAPQWDALLSQLTAHVPFARRPKVLFSTELLAPLTCGAFRAHIVLPAAAIDWSSDRRRAVLLHELAHIKRRDVAAQLFVHLMTSIWWFQPLAWILRGALRTESELACDAEALASGFRPSQYAAELLAIAKSLGENAALANQSLASFGISMARNAGLEFRVRAVLDPPSHFLSPVRVRAALVCLSAVALAASTVTAQSKSTDPGGLIMKRSLFSGLLTSVSLSAAAVSGSLFDPSGAAVPDAKLLLYNPDTGAKQEALSGPDGRFILENAPPGQYILRIEKPGFSSLFREFNLKADSRIDRGFTLSIGHGHQEVAVETKGTTTSSQPADAPTRVRVGGRVEQENLIQKVQPVYPVAAKSAGVQGIVELEAAISKEGVPLELRVVSSPSDDLTQSALEAVRQWRYRPVLLNGQPIEVVTDVVVNYTLSQ